MARLSRSLLAVAGLGAAGLAYSVVEAHRYTLRRAEAAVLPAGQSTLRVLHLSDLHLTPRHTGRMAWVSALDALEPDLVVVTGDFLSHLEAVPSVLDRARPAARPARCVRARQQRLLRARPGEALALPHRAVRGERAPAAAAVGRPRRRACPRRAGPTCRTPAPGSRVDGREIDVRGVDDPHIHRDRYADVAGPFDPDADLALGVTHAPYLRVLDAMAADGAGLVLAGHTHGGQLAIPGYGAIVTNCDLPPAQAKGLSRHGRPWDGTGDPGLGGVDGRGAVLHVSAGLGTSPYAPVRFACPPEATLLTLTPVM